MDFKKVKLVIEGYIHYCNFMLRSNLQLTRNKKYNQFEIRHKKKKGDIGKIIMIIETGQINDKIIVQCCHNIYVHYHNLFEIWDKNIRINFNQIEIIIGNEDELFELFQSLEKIEYFNIE